MSTFDKFKEIVVNHLGVDASAVTPEAEIIEDLGADSLDLVEMVMASEADFDVVILDEVLETVVTVQDAVNAIENALSSSGEAA